MSVVATAVAAEIVVLLAYYAGSLAATGSCTREYEPNLDLDSSRYAACQDEDLAFYLIPVALALVPLGAVMAMVRSGTILHRVGVVVGAAATACFLIVVRYQLLSWASPSA